MVPTENLLDRANSQRERARMIVPAGPVAEVGVPGQAPLEELPPPARLGAPQVDQP
jgi:hypothetical protein